MKTNSIDKEKIISTINEINELTALTKSSLNNMDNLIKDNINTNKGIWDGESASIYLKEWEKISEEIPELVEIFEKQAKNLLVTINEINLTD